MNTTNGNWKETKNGRKLYVGFCSKCDTKQSVFTNDQGYYNEGEKTKEELIKKAKASKRKKALKIGLKVLDNDAKDCVIKCIKQKPKTTTPVSKSVSTQLVPFNVSESKKRKIEFE
jgi:hypothetical protein